MATLSKAKQKRSWQDVAKEAQEYRDASIAVLTADFPPGLDGDEFSELPRNSIDISSAVLRPRDIQITERPPEELIRAIGNGELSVIDVTTAFLRRAALAQKLVSLKLSQSRL